MFNRTFKRIESFLTLFKGFAKYVGQVGASMDRYGQVWTRRGKYGQVGVSMDR